MSKPYRGLFPRKKNVMSPGDVAAYSASRPQLNRAPSSTRPSSAAQLNEMEAHGAHQDALDSAARTGFNNVLNQIQTLMPDAPYHKQFMLAKVYAKGLVHEMKESLPEGATNQEYDEAFINMLENIDPNQVKTEADKWMAEKHGGGSMYRTGGQVPPTEPVKLQTATVAAPQVEYERQTRHTEEFPREAFSFFQSYLHGTNPYGKSEWGPLVDAYEAELFRGEAPALTGRQQEMYDTAKQHAIDRAREKGYEYDVFINRETGEDVPPEVVEEIERRGFELEPAPGAREAAPGRYTSPRNYRINPQ